MHNNNAEQFSLAKKMMASFVGLFTLFVISILITLVMVSHLNDNILEIKQTLSFLSTLQWVLLTLGLLGMAATSFWWFKRGAKENQAYQEMLATLNAIYKSQAIIEFNMDGTIITANDKFLEVVGYDLDEVVGKHHSMLVEKDYKDSQEYKEFWQKLNRGQYDQAEYKRIKKGGKEIWLQSCYNPILDSHGHPIKVIKVATDITERKLQEAKSAQLTEKLQQIGKQIIAESNDLSAGISQLETSAVAQASSASEQATSVSEISATIEEIKTTTKQTLEKAKGLGEAASLINKEAEKGKSATEKMGEAMQVLQSKMEQISSTIIGLNDKTEQVGEITESVSDIARQSKMLALNASIEAARAGESGKGFAVVAVEVKELAEKSQVSTERVQKILQDIQQSVEQAVLVTAEGTKSVDKNTHQVKLTGDIINALAKVIEESSVASLQIVSAVREESIAIDQIDLSVKEVDKVTSLFASASEQTKQAVISLRKVSASLLNTAKEYQD